MNLLLVGLFLIMFTLKLCGIISWSWWVVCSPLLAFAVLFVLAIGIILLKITGFRTGYRKRRF